MVKYEYRPELEVFRRVDNRGPSLKFNIVEGRRIKSMMDLGIKAPSIYTKINFVNNVSMTNLRTFMNNLEDGNIDLDGDYPVPTEIIEEINYDIEIHDLRRRVTDLEKKLSEIEKNESALDKFKGWLKR